MLTYKETNAGFPLSLNGRGARGEGALLILSSFLFYLFSAPAALAQNECGATDGLPGTADTVTCNPADYDSGYPNGITYSSDGDLTLEVPDGADDLNVFDDGISVTGTGADTVSLDTSAFIGIIQGTDGAIVDYSSNTGDIVIDTSTPESPQFSALRGSNNATHGILATSAGDGDINILSRSIQGGGTADFTAVEATTNGGDITITGSSQGLGSTSFGSIRRAIVAETSGDGAILLDLPNVGVSSATGIYTFSDTGSITMSVDSVNFRNDDTSVSDVGIHAVTGGAITIDLGQMLTAYTGIATENSALATINLEGPLTGPDEGPLAGMGTAIRSTGTDVVVNISGEPGEDLGERAGIYSALDFSGLTGHAEVNVQANGAWQPVGSVANPSLFSDGDDVVTVVQSGVVHMEELALFVTPDDVAVVDFGGGSDTFDNAGLMYIAPHSINEFNNQEARSAYEGDLRFENLETFNHSGTIYMGTNPDRTGTDRVFDDRLSMPGADFVGDDGRIVLDVSLNNVGAPGDVCDNSARDAEGNFKAADCIDLQGGTASGRTGIVFKTLIPGDRGALNPDGTLIVDVAGGSADPDAFVVSPDSDFYSPQFGGIIDKGLFFYPLAYDAETQQFKLFGQPSSAAQQVTIMGNVANDLWRTVTDGWFGRQVDQRDIFDHGELTDNGGSVWIRFAANAAERDVTTPIIAGVETFEFDNSYTQDDSSMTVGRDFIFRGDGDRAWLAGAMIGYARSRVDFDAHPNSANLEGIHFGFYGSATMGDFFLDAAVNGNWADLDYDAPVLDLFPEGTVLSTDVVSLGAQVEAGWRGLNFGRVGIEPLANLSYVVSDFEDVFVPAADPTRGGGNFEFDDPKSFRGGLGARLSVNDVLPAIAPTHLGLTARVVEEFEGESTATITSTGPIPVDQTDTFEGTFTELTGSVNVTNTAKTVSGYLNVDAAFGDDYDSLGISAGFRYQW